MSPTWLTWSMTRPWPDDRVLDREGGVVEASVEAVDDGFVGCGRTGQDRRGGEVR
jgi:hypothetical protein